MMLLEGRTMTPTYRDVLMTYAERQSPYWPFWSWVVDPDDGYDLDAPSELSQVLARYQAWGWKLVSTPPAGGEAVFRATFRLDLPETSVFLPLLEVNEPVGIPDGWRIGTAPGFVQRRECYRRAWRYLEHHQEIPALKLVHGSVFSPDKDGRIGHAWVLLPGGVVFDGVVQRFYAVSSYHAITRSQADAFHSWSDARHLHEQPVIDCADPSCRARGASHCHLYGPWEETSAVSTHSG
jgi:hypothetical protein